MKKAKIFAFVAFTFLCMTTFAQSKTSVPGLSFAKLDNGLEVFILENHNLPLTRIQITFRCGAYTQEPETAGLFHFYEHLLFKGNSVYKTENQFSGAMSDLGVASWNGGTSAEYVTYFFTVPSDKTDEGLAFWSYAVKEPLFDEEEVEIEKGVVINEITGDLANPQRALWAAVQKNLYPKFPWRRDVIGTPDHINSATPELMRQIQHKYYVPNNAAIFVAGDVNPKEVLTLVKKHYGDWEKSKPLPAMEPQLTPAQSKPLYLVFEHESLPQGLAATELLYRGPDVIRTPEPTYAADVWGALLASPTGKFKQNMFDALPTLYEKNETSASYFTQRDGAEVYSTTLFLANGEVPLAQATKDFQKAFLDETKKMVADGDYFTAEEFAIVKRRLEDDQFWALENPENFVESLSFWWSAASADYYFDYVKKMNGVSKADINKFLTDYVVNNVPIVLVITNPKDYAREKAHFDKAGFLRITPENAFWWRNK